MPIVPIFQGGVPQVGASRTPTTPLRVPSPSVDYARVMQAALEPLKVGVDAAAKLQRQEEARQIKALSDEAETAYMNSVNARMIDPETGYLNQRGKTASENYKATVDGLRGDADKIIGGLAPYVRQAVESRIEDRFLAAQSQAMRWNAQQTQAWQVPTGDPVEAIGWSEDAQRLVVKAAGRWWTPWSNHTARDSEGIIELIRARQPIVWRQTEIDALPQDYVQELGMQAAPAFGERGRS